MGRPHRVAMAAVLFAATAANVSLVVPASGAQSTAGHEARPAPTASTSGPDDDLVVDRDDEGNVVGMRATTGTAFRQSPEGVTPRRAAQRHAGRLADTFGVSAGDLSVSRVLPAAAGGSVVRLRQEHDGLPVLGGEMVMSLDADGGLLSVVGQLASVPDGTGGSTSPGTRGPVSSSHAADVALASVAKRQGVSPSGLGADPAGEWLYDPALLGLEGGLRPRPVWRVEVTDGFAVRETVLVDSASGRVLLHVDEVQEALDRQVCDAQDQQKSLSDCALQTSPARTETGPVSAVADVNSAFDLTGEAAQMYADVAGLDLTQLIGSGGGSYPKKLSSWVRSCPPSPPDLGCPMANAFWNGTQMVFGDGYAGADDVVAHEMTHGVIQKFSDLFYFHQSGAINESLADVMGEILDHRNVSEGETPDDWRLGEDLPGGALRDLADPTLFGQPDRMTSPLYDADPTLADNGGVHTNSGVGNKTAYLISQGGTFNGVTVEGIDAGDPMLTKTAALYAQVIERLTSGAGYADLARTLEQTCAELAATGAAGFGDADCVDVAAAVQATELREAPTVPGAAPPPDVEAACPEGTVKDPLFTNDGSLSGLTRSDQYLWVTAPNAEWDIPANARTGATSLLGFDPDPAAYGDPYSAYVQMSSAVTLPAGQPAYLHFDHWRLFEYAAGDPPTYDDGGQVSVYAATAPSGPFTAQTMPDSAWVNGPSEPLALNDPAHPVPGFGGDSHGWTSSRLDLSGLAGQSVKIRWTVRGDGSGSFLGWFLDNAVVYTCRTPVAPGAVDGLGSSPLRGPRVRLSWNAPTQVGDGLIGYVVEVSDGVRRSLPAETTTFTTDTLERGKSYRFTVRALGPDVAGPARSSRVWAPKVALVSPPSRVRKGIQVVFRGTVKAADTGTPARGSLANLQWRRPGTTRWRWVLPNGDRLYSKVRSDGTYRIVARARRTFVYRVILPSYPHWFPGTSRSVKVRVGG